MKEHMIGFHRWMLKHDTADNAEAYFHYTDEDMVEEYLREVSTQDPAICNYSGLRPVEGYKEEKTDEEVMKEGEIMRIKMYEYDEEVDKELNKRAIIVDLDTEEGEKLAEAYKRGYADGYHEGVYDRDYK